MFKIKENESKWFKSFYEGLVEIQLTKVLDLLELIQEAEGKETREFISKIENSIEGLVFTTDELNRAKNRFVLGSLDEADMYIKQKLQRKFNTIKKRVSRQVPVEFSSYLKNLRLSQNLTLREVEAKSGISISYIHLLEKGAKKSPNISILNKLADVYGVSVSDFNKIIGVEETSTELSSLLNNNKISINGVELSSSKSNSLIKLVEAIDKSKWDEDSKHLESITIMNLIEEYKKTK